MRAQEETEAGEPQSGHARSDVAARFRHGKQNGWPARGEFKDARAVARRGSFGGTVSQRDRTPDPRQFEAALEGWRVEELRHRGCTLLRA